MRPTRVTQAMQVLAAVALACAAACAGSEDSGINGGVDGGVSGDSISCGTAISFDPTEPEANALAPIRAAVNVVGAPGVFTYTWDVTFNGNAVPFTMEASDNSQIGFLAPNPGPYQVTVSISGPVAGCNYADGFINVLQPGANSTFYRLRTVPSASTVPPQETVIQVRGGADVVRDISLDPGITANLAVQQSGTGTGVQAYVKMMPVSAPNAFTEVFTLANGTFSTKLLGQDHTALVIPTSTAIAPALVTWTPTSTALVIGTGSVVSGIVRGPSGTGLSGAKVQLSSSGVPSTLATTVADGSFSLRTSYAAGATVTVKVTPPAASGLPRLEATGVFNLGSSVQVTYAASLATCDLATTPVRRAAVNQPGAKVTVVGTLPGTAGTVITGATTVNATGTVRVAATANGSGVLPAMLVPRAASLSAVIELDTNDLAIDTINTSTCPAQTLDAPALIVRTGIVKNAANAVLSNVRVEATPIGTLAQADAQTVTAMTDAGGAFSISLASGARYDVRFVDPYARAARLEALNIAPASVPTTATLPTSLAISGKVVVLGSAQPVTSASIQLLCATCTGLAASRPVAETASDGLGAYRIAVPDPGSM
jgi:hypothetical protein